MAQGILDRDAGPLREPDDEKLLWTQASIFSGILHQPIAPIDRTRQERLVRFQGFHEPARVPQALISIGREPAGTANLETRCQVQHFLLGAGAAVEQNPGALRQAPRRARLAQADR